jgi:hypothetical protein
MLNFQIHLKLKQVIKIEECHERSIVACLKLLLNEKLGLSALYPNNSIHLMSTAAVIGQFIQQINLDIIISFCH